MENTSWLFLLEKAVGVEGESTADTSATLDPCEGAFCRQTITADAPVGTADVRGTDWEDDPVHRKQGLTSYLGTKVTSGSTPYGALWFASTEPASGRSRTPNTRSST